MSITVRIAFDSDPFDSSYSWTEVNAIEGHTKRGRQFALDRTEAGTATVILPNMDGAYWQGNTGSAYYGKVLPDKPINIRRTYGGVTYDIYTGFINRWQPVWLGANRVAAMRLECSDFMAMAAQHEINDGAGYSEELSGERLGNILDEIGWPVSTSDADYWLLGVSGNSELGETTILAGSIGAGQTTIAASGALSGVNALGHMQDVAETERGLLFINTDGSIAFHDRYHRRINSRDAAAVFGDGELEERYTSFVPVLENRRIYNIVRVTRTGGTEQEASDTDSRDAHGPRVKRFSLLLTTDGEALTAAQYILSTNKDAHEEVRELPIHPDRNPSTLFPLVLGLDISDRITLKYSPASFDADFFIEGVRHDFKAGGAWETIWQLSPAETGDFWMLGLEGLTELGETTILGY